MSTRQLGVNLAPLYSSGDALHIELQPIQAPTFPRQESYVINRLTKAKAISKKLGTASISFALPTIAVPKTDDGFERELYERNKEAFDNLLFVAVGEAQPKAVVASFSLETEVLDRYITIAEAAETAWLSSLVVSALRPRMAQLATSEDRTAFAFEAPGANAWALKEEKAPSRIPINLRNRSLIMQPTGQVACWQGSTLSGRPLEILIGISQG